MKIRCDEILYNPEGQNVSRELFTAESCESLAAAIDRQGLTHPVNVVPLPEGHEKKYKLIAGFRRFVAIAEILGWDEIPCVVREDIHTLEEEHLVNYLENLERKDTSFWEECLGLKRMFKPDKSMTDIAKIMGRSRQWVRPRWLIWSLDQEILDELIPLVREGICLASDVELIILKENKDRIASLKALIEAHKEGTKIRDTLRQSSKRKQIRKVPEIQRAMTVMMENEKPDCVQALRFACGEITDQQLYNYLGCKESTGDEPCATEPSLP